jgi:hypothetical protein
MLFKESNTLKAFAQLSGTIDFNAVKSTIDFVENQHIIPVIGKEQYEELNQEFQNATSETSLPDRLKNLLKFCRSVVGPWLCYYYAPKADVQLSDAGVRRQETSTSKTAYQYQVKQFIEAALLEAELSTEFLLNYLEDNLTDFPLWSSSDQFKEYRSLFIKTGREMNRYFHTASPSRNYFAMKNKMHDVEQVNIKKFLGEDLFEALKTKDAGDQNFTTKEKELLHLLKKSIAAFTVSFSIPLLNVRISGNGLTVAADVPRSSNDEMSSRSNANNEAISLIMKQSASTGEMWLDQAKKYLLANPTDFSTWPGNITPETTNIIQPKKSVYGLI